MLDPIIAQFRAGPASRRRSSLCYGVMVIDMGVHELSGLEEPINVMQVG